MGSSQLQSDNRVYSQVQTLASEILNPTDFSFPLPYTEEYRLCANCTCKCLLQIKSVVRLMQSLDFWMCTFENIGLLMITVSLYKAND